MLGVTVTVTAWLFAPAAIVTGPLLVSVIADGEVIVSGIVVLAVIAAFDASVPVTVTVYAPAVVVEVVLIVTPAAMPGPVMLTTPPGVHVGGLVGFARFEFTAQARFTFPT